MGDTATDYATVAHDVSHGDFNGAMQAYNRVQERNNKAAIAVVNGVAQMNPTTIAMNVASYGADLYNTAQTKGLDAAMDKASYDFGYTVVGGGAETALITGVTMGAGEFLAPEAAAADLSATEATGQVAYGSTDLSQTAIQARLSTPGMTGEMSSVRNTAVFEYSTDDGLQVATRFSERGVGHAERLVWRDLQSVGVDPSQVTRIYSELEPCSVPGGYCGAWIARTFPQARVTWSFQYGLTQASRISGVGALIEAVSKL